MNSHIEKRMEIQKNVSSFEMFRVNGYFSTDKIRNFLNCELHRSSTENLKIEKRRKKFFMEKSVSMRYQHNVSVDSDGVVYAGIFNGKISYIGSTKYSALVRWKQRLSKIELASRRGNFSGLLPFERFMWKEGVQNFYVYPLEIL